MTLSPYEPAGTAVSIYGEIFFLIFRFQTSAEICCFSIIRLWVWYVCICSMQLQVTNKCIKWVLFQSFSSRETPHKLCIRL